MSKLDETIKFRKQKHNNWENIGYNEYKEIEKITGKFPNVYEQIMIQATCSTLEIAIKAVCKSRYGDDIYMDNMREYYKEKARNKYLPKKDKSGITSLGTSEDDYEVNHNKE
ncbi:MAG: hypothetical protein PUK09_05845 [Bacilli bacterium]|nr:hypothetical protein [Bacilli bacterium]